MSFKNLAQFVAKLEPVIMPPDNLMGDTITSAILGKIDPTTVVWTMEKIKAGGGLVWTSNIGIGWYLDNHDRYFYERKGQLTEVSSIGPANFIKHVNNWNKRGMFGLCIPIIGEHAIASGKEIWDHKSYLCE